MANLPIRKNKPKMPSTKVGTPKAPTVNPMDMPKQKRKKMGADPVKTAPLMKTGGSVTKADLAAFAKKDKVEDKKMIADAVKGKSAKMNCGGSIKKK